MKDQVKWVKEIAERLEQLGPQNPYEKDAAKVMDNAQMAVHIIETAVATLYEKIHKAVPKNDEVICVSASLSDKLASHYDIETEHYGEYGGTVFGSVRIEAVFRVHNKDGWHRVVIRHKWVSHPFWQYTPTTTEEK